MLWDIFTVITVILNASHVRRLCVQTRPLPPVLPSVLYSLFLPGRLPLLLVDLMVGVTQFDLGVVRQAGGDDVQLQVFVVLHKCQRGP